MKKILIFLIFPSLLFGQLNPNVLVDCTDQYACNYNADAIATCEDVLTYTYNEEDGVVMQDGSDGFPDCCVYPIVYYLDCNYECLNDTDSDGICDELEINGCTDESACNYNFNATNDDGSCYSQLEISPIITHPNCEQSNGSIQIFINNGTPPYVYDWSNGEQSELIDNLDSDSYSVLVSDSLNCSTLVIYELTDDSDGDGVCNENEIFGCTDINSYSGYNPLATEEDGSCSYCASLDFANTSQSLNMDFGFQDATGVTVSFWMYDEDWSLEGNNEDEFSYLIDLGDVNSYRYVIRWRDGIKGLQAYYEGDGFQNFQGVDCDGNADDNCYNYNQTNATYIIPPYDYVDDLSIYNWWESEDCSWKNVTAVFCSNAVTLYIDGHMVQQRSTGVYYPIPIFNLTESSQIGSGWDGKMDEVRVWSRALSQQEIQERVGDGIDINLYLDSEESDAGKLEAYFKFDFGLNNQYNMSQYYCSVNPSMQLVMDSYSFSNQYCDYLCNNYNYSLACSDNSNNDCDACTPAEGCMDENADNYDPVAEIDNGLCIYYGCMDNGTHIWSHIPGLEACNYDPNANANQYSMTDFQNPCIYPIDVYGVGYVDCDGTCLYDCDGDGACDWNQSHCYDTEGNLINNLDQINNYTFDPIPDGILDCLSFTYVDSVDNCVFNSNIDILNNLTLDTISDGVPDCLDDFDYDIYYNPLQTDTDNDGFGNSCDNDDGGQLGCLDINACNYNFWADIQCLDCCEYCYLDDCDTYPTTYYPEDGGAVVDGPYDCSGYCADLNSDGLYDDFDSDAICDLLDNCIAIWNPNQMDSDGDGVGDACEQSSISIYDNLSHIIFPNPFSDYTVISLLDSNIDNALIKIYTLSGSLILSRKVSKNMEKVYKSDLGVGFFILEINNNNQIERNFLIVQ